MLVEKETIIPLVGKETFQKKIVKACENTITKAIQFETPELLEEAVKKLKRRLLKMQQNSNGVRNINITEHSEMKKIL
ncbi:MAG: hypothetical protein IPI53_08235 [Saprospiraceae bacterium]|nr:hypothetical protein [Saprospiraceae bacterium]